MNKTNLITYNHIFNKDRHVPCANAISLDENGKTSSITLLELAFVIPLIKLKGILFRIDCEIN